MAATTDRLLRSVAIIVLQATAASANVGGAAARHQRYSFSVISIAPTGVAAKRGEDPAVNGSHGGKEGGGVEDDNNNKYHKGGGEEAGHRRVIFAPSSFNAAGAVANVRDAVVAVGKDDGVHRPPEICQHCQASIPISVTL
jgi:hypothetical protein